MSTTDTAPAAHTPGPWKIATTYRDAQNGRYSVVSWDDQSRTLARIQHADVSTADANARLMAAAPTLLAVLQRVAEHFGVSDAPLGLAAHAAIAEATGQDQP